MSFVPLMLLSPLLLYVGYSDLRYMKIPNVLSIIAIVGFAASLLFFPAEDLMMRVVAASCVFALGFLGFCFRMLGGGDVKILSVLILFVPVSSLSIFMYAFSAALILGVAAVVTLRARPIHAIKDWQTSRASGKLPMGISIAAAGIVHPYLVLLG